MSGTSLDGLDLALCQFNSEENKINYKVIACQTIEYKHIWKQRLQQAYEATAEQYFKLNSLYAEFIATEVNTFLEKNNAKADYIASHGHTVFHRPALGFTTQMGCGATIKAKTNISTICDFRSVDVALGGQGAPLVPIGDRDLFSEYEACLNIGGIANVSFTKNNALQAFDICYANMILNDITALINKNYDDKGMMASQGNISNVLLSQLLSIETHNQSLGRELYENAFLPILKSHPISIEDKLATCVEYSAQKISEVLNSNQLKSLLITGGGAYNDFLITRIKHYFKGVIEIPRDEIIQFKEAIIFAYLGYLRINNLPNAIASVTGAAQNSVGGCIY